MFYNIIPRIQGIILFGKVQARGRAKRVLDPISTSNPKTEKHSLGPEPEKQSDRGRVRGPGAQTEVQSQSTVR